MYCCGAHPPGPHHRPMSVCVCATMDASYALSWCSFSGIAALSCVCVFVCVCVPARVRAFVLVCLCACVCVNGCSHSCCCAPLFEQKYQYNFLSILPVCSHSMLPVCSHYITSTTKPCTFLHCKLTSFAIPAPYLLNFYAPRARTLLNRSFANVFTTVTHCVICIV